MECKSEKLRKFVKVKNPCKICETAVRQKTGLQCNGACKKWMHYACLDYTPGKIQDIKDGFIKIICPCPDCQGSGPKEVAVAKPPYKCAKSCCPRTKSRTCDLLECPVNKHKGHRADKQCEIPSACGLLTPQNPLFPNVCEPQCGAPPVGMPLNNIQSPVQSNLTACSKASCQKASLWQPDGLEQPFGPECGNLFMQSTQVCSNQPYYETMKPITQQQQFCPSCSLPPDHQQSNQSVAQCFCSSSQQVAAQLPASKKVSRNKKDQLNGLLSYVRSAKQSKSCSCISNESKRKDKCLEKDKGQSEINLREESLYANLDEMCKTVGQLTTQIRDLMCKIAKHAEGSKMLKKEQK